MKPNPSQVTDYPPSEIIVKGPVRVTSFRIWNVTSEAQTNSVYIAPNGIPMVVARSTKDAARGGPVS